MSDSDKENENQILEPGEKLIVPPSIDELLSLIDRRRSVRGRTSQETHGRSKEKAHVQQSGDSKRRQETKPARDPKAIHREILLFRFDHKRERFSSKLRRSLRKVMEVPLLLLEQ
ncbi:unnamed protein product [Eruca vesicaria subsp. sativa]|uniref:Uncharacterized protein n=1 Tax=Eruca vesicaria subsp. sativa TaxID=29727 RepID=A0ABC8JPL3_ERUVS|nr:unnamed protein product [Eruca vesicaria subsp. sativa]